MVTLKAAKIGLGLYWVTFTAVFAWLALRLGAAHPEMGFTLFYVVILLWAAISVVWLSTVRYVSTLT